MGLLEETFYLLLIWGIACRQSIDGGYSIDPARSVRTPAIGMPFIQSERIRRRILTAHSAAAVVVVTGCAFE